MYDDFVDVRPIVKKLIDYGYLSGAVEGIAKQVANRGESSLTSRQANVFSEAVREEYFHLECERCHTDIPICEVAEAIDNGGYCSWCQHQNEKPESDND